MTHTCQGIKRNGERCTNFGRYNGYCGLHRNQEPILRCEFETCSNPRRLHSRLCERHQQHQCIYQGCSNLNLSANSYCLHHYYYNIQAIIDELEYIETRIQFHTNMIRNGCRTMQKPKPKKIITMVTLDNPCSICLEEFVINEEIYELKCGHHYHTQCLDEWMNNKHTCPLDRKQIE